MFMFIVFFFPRIWGGQIWAQGSLAKTVLLAGIGRIVSSNNPGPRMFREEKICTTTVETQFSLFFGVWGSLVYTLFSGPMVYTLFPCFPKAMVHTIIFFALRPRRRATDRERRGATMVVYIFVPWCWSDQDLGTEPSSAVHDCFGSWSPPSQHQHDGSGSQGEKRDLFKGDAPHMWELEDDNQSERGRDWPDAESKRIAIGNGSSARSFSDQSFLNPPLWGHGRLRLRAMDVRTDMRVFFRISRLWPKSLPMDVRRNIRMDVSRISGPKTYSLGCFCVLDASGGTFMKVSARTSKVPEGHHPRGTALREALQGNLPLRGLCGGLSEGSAESCRGLRRVLPRALRRSTRFSEVSRG